MMELGLVGRTSGSETSSERPHMEHNDSHKFESAFLGVDVQQGGHSVLLDSLSGSSLGLWVAHGEGKFVLPGREEDYNVVLKYAYEGYPANPNSGTGQIDSVCSLLRIQKPEPAPSGLYKTCIPDRVWA